MSVTPQDRERVKAWYPNKRWAEKVDKMSDSQVTAILLRMRAYGPRPKTVVRSDRETTDHYKLRYEQGGSSDSDDA